MRCETLETAQSDDPREILRAHAANMRRARVCANRHDTLVDVLNARQ